MNQIILGYIPKDWKDDDYEDRPGWIATGNDDGTISNNFEYENLDESDEALDPEDASCATQICIDPEGKHICMPLEPEGNFTETFKKLSEEYFSAIQKSNKNLDIPSALRIGWYILGDEGVPPEDVFEKFGVSDVISITGELDANEFCNEGGKYNGCIYLNLRGPEDIDSGEDGLMYILVPLQN